MKPAALTMGEPAGIAGEITAKAWAARREYALPPFFFIGDADYLAAQGVPVRVIDDPKETQAVFDAAVPVLPVPLKVSAQPGRPDPLNAPAILQSIETAVALCREDRAVGMVTNPIQKESLYAAGFEFPGHTEYLAHLCGLTHPPVMMLEARGNWGVLRTVPLTIHIPLKDVSVHLTSDLIIEQAMIVHAALKQEGIESLRLALAGLNPHAGEGGRLGQEEETILAPALAALKEKEIIVSGPHSADTLFHAAAREKYDVALCCYHDQALIPVKTLDFEGGVNVTLGLPIRRASPDHGTALDIAGQGRASPASLIAAIRRVAGA